ncbi:conjugal transfer protein TraI [Mucilaginibacter sp. RS28]|uniref:Conjugal transfer protein TraI n=1 Tax=Mucilaginibacter straminoryzae TaxID=2932774 RepID=A0A9X2B7V9_9SPHI|nr:conjugal transfer protein TraI [Mucilaginibacter straminoryzae]MCJ8208110.1 conjugal transfer protein TraI [Mucilaginibacter straminoryzae]
MKRTLITTGLLLTLLGIGMPKADAQIPIVSLVSSAIKKVIVALDIKVQQLQNQTIQLQQAEQQLENSKTLASFKDINGWLGKEKDLFSKYYSEMQQVRQVIAGYSEVKQVISRQAQLVAEYRKAWNLFQQDKNFSADELRYMSSVYNGILAESLQNLQELTATVTSFSAQMEDGERMERIKKIAAAMQHNLDDLRQFNTAGVDLSLQRSIAARNTAQVRQLYGIN